jgi:hypothetical protein
VIELLLLLMTALVAAVATGLWAWHDHLRTHPWAARPSGTVGRAVDRWERLTARAGAHPGR